MEKYMIEANEMFFKNVIETLNDGGIYVFPSAMKSYQKKGNFLVGTKDALDCVRDIVSNNFFQTHFKQNND